ncbi:MAG: GSCFA domain-containing protein [Bacteroidales bacterium]|nr:GSCFA domain-containing protein [Bacteroidales bacterium]
MKLTTTVNVEAPSRPLSLSDRIMTLGSCFADSIAEKMSAAGFQVCANPFGALYNPMSVESAVRRLDSGRTFTREDCVRMGAGAGLICSFEHHTSFARASEEEFLDNANGHLAGAAAFWSSANVVIITLGTAFVWYHDKRPVSNCLKLPAREFERRMLDASEAAAALKAVIDSHPEKRFILTVSPIRHMGDGAHANALSKARLLLAAESAAADYFPAFEIMMDELRDYRFYAEDLVHPSPTAVSIIWERFLDSYTDPAERSAIEANEKAARLSAHRKIL